MHLYYCHLWLLLKNSPPHPGLLDSYIHNSELHTVHLAPPSPDKKCVDSFFPAFSLLEIVSSYPAIHTIQSCMHFILLFPLLDQKRAPIHSCEICLPFLYQSLLNCYLHNSKLHMFVLFYLPLRTKIDKYIDFYSCQSWTIRNCSLISRLSG